MNNIINKFLSAGNNFMSEMDLKHPRFTSSACGPYTKEKHEYKNSKKPETQYIYRNKLDKTCFQHDMADGYFKYLPRRTASDKVLSDKAFTIASDPKLDRYKVGLASMVYKYFDKKAGDIEPVHTGTENGISKTQEFENELHNPIITKF